MRALADKNAAMRTALFYPRLWLRLFWNSAQRSLEYRINFVGRTVTELVWLSSQVVFALALASGSHLIKGWSAAELFLFFGGVALLDALFMLFLHENLRAFDSIIREGTFDFYLLRPVSTFFLASFRFPSVIAVVNFVFALGMIAYGMAGAGHSIASGNILLGLLYLMAGFFLVILFNVFIMSIGFWMTRSSILVWMFFEFYRLSFRPDDFYFSWLRRILLTVFPAAFFISVPVKILLGKEVSLWMWLGPWVLLAIGVPLVNLLWQRGIKNYEGALS